MYFARNVTMWMFMILSVVWLAGCAGQQPAGQSSEESDEHGDHNHSHGGESKIAKAMAGLSSADRELAERQRICPVTDELLGSMGTPLKVQVSGHSVFICCEGCRNRLVDNPGEYLPKIGL